MIQFSKKTLNIYTFFGLKANSYLITLLTEIPFILKLLELFDETTWLRFSAVFIEKKNFNECLSYDTLPAKNHWSQKVGRYYCCN